jgi:Na+/H+ antiporter NhaA
VFAIIVAVAFLAMPVSGTIAGIAINMPMIGWIIGGILALFVLFIAVTKRK